MYTTREVRKQFIRIDNTPLWVAPDAIEALVPDTETGETHIVLASGTKATTSATVEEIIGFIRTANNQESDDE